MSAASTAVELARSIVARPSKTTRLAIRAGCVSARGTTTAITIAPSKSPARCRASRTASVDFIPPSRSSITSASIASRRARATVTEYNSLLSIAVARSAAMVSSIWSSLSVHALSPGTTAARESLDRPCARSGMTA